MQDILEAFTEILIGKIGYNSSEADFILLPYFYLFPM